MPTSDGPKPGDLLANERTFLAYLRTALSIVAFGFVIAKFALFTREISGALHLATQTRQVSTSFGTAVALFGALVAVYGGYRFVVTDRALARGETAPLTTSAAVAGAGIVALLGVAVGVALVAFR